jgi:phosphoribosylaminoimidazole-succinocarboxamide synthase
MGMNNLSADPLEVTGIPLLRQGKVRDVYDLGENLLIVSTDRLSAFDWVLESPIPGKGKILTAASLLWFELTKKIVPNHLITADLGEIRKQLPSSAQALWENLEGRTMLVKKAKRVDAECIARGYLAGSGFKEYKKSRSVCGEPLPEGLLEASILPHPLFTPSTKADQGHDRNISFEELKSLIGSETASKLKKATLQIYEFASHYSRSRGLILADTKFEFGFVGSELMVIDEMLTPDSSRFWDARLYRPGSSPASFDKQFVRDYLEKTGWDKNSKPPMLPQEIVEQTQSRYLQFLKMIKA